VQYFLVNPHGPCMAPWGFHETTATAAQDKPFSGAKRSESNCHSCSERDLGLAVVRVGVGGVYQSDEWICDTVRPLAKESFAPHWLCFVHRRSRHTATIAHALLQQRLLKAATPPTERANSITPLLRGRPESTRHPRALRCALPCARRLCTLLRRQKRGRPTHLRKHTPRAPHPRTRPTS